MDTQTRSQYAEAGRKKASIAQAVLPAYLLIALEEFRRKKAEERVAAEKAEASQIATHLPRPPLLPPPPKSTAAAGEEEPTPIPLVADVVPLADSQMTAPGIATTFMAATEAPSWPSPKHAGASAAAGAAALTTAPSDRGPHNTAADSFKPLERSNSLPQKYHQGTLEQQQQLQEREPTSASAIQPAVQSAAAAPYEASSFSSYNNLLADPPLPPPPLDQVYFQPQPLFESSAAASVQSNGASGDVISNDGIAAEDKDHHHSSFLSSMQLGTSTTTMDTKSASFLSKDTPNPYNGNGNGKETLTFGIKNDTTISPSQSRSARSTSPPTPSSPNTTSTTTVSIAAAADGVSRQGNRASTDNNSIEGNNSIVTMPKDFKELQHHIGELTEEKFTIQRCLEQQTALADRLAAENEELTVQVNASGRAIEEIRHELDVRRREVAVARAEIATAMAERDAYEMGARESSERAKTLAMEVVALEEKMLKMKSEELKMISEKEKAGNKNMGEKEKKFGVSSGGGGGGGEEDDPRLSSSSATAAVLAAERRAEMVSAQLNAAHQQIEIMKREKLGAEQHFAKVNAEVEALTRSREEERKEAAAVAASFAQRVERGAALAAAGAKEEEEESSRSLGRDHEQHQVVHPPKKSAELKEPLKPPPSVLLAGEAMIEAENQSKSRKEKLIENEEEHEDAAVPAEIRALLPPAVWTPGAQGLDPSVHDLVERIYEVVGVLESERSETDAALAAQRQTNVALQARLEALLASQELELQKSDSQVGATRKLKSSTDTNGSPVQRKWTPGYVSATLAEAWADVLRTKAQAKYNKSDTDILPQPVPAPQQKSKSKTFAYTSIRASSDFTGTLDENGDNGGNGVNGDNGDNGGIIDSVPAASAAVPPVQQQVANPFVTTAVPVSGAQVANPFVTTTVPVSGARSGGAVAAGTGTPPSPEQPHELQAKLQQLQKQLEELEALKAELDASKTTTVESDDGTADSRRKLLDSGTPGWDPGMLLEKVQLDSVEDTSNL